MPLLPSPFPAFTLNGVSINVDMLVEQKDHRIVELQNEIELEANHRKNVYIDLSEEAHGIGGIKGETRTSDGWRY